MLLLAVWPPMLPPLMLLQLVVRVAYVVGCAVCCAAGYECPWEALMTARPHGWVRTYLVLPRELRSYPLDHPPLLVLWAFGGPGLLLER